MLRILSLLDAQGIGDGGGVNVHLQCGYFESNSGRGERPDPFSDMTLRFGVALASQLKARWPGTRVQFCTLVNNLGQTCGQEACEAPSTISDVAIDKGRAHVEAFFRRHGIDEGFHSFYFEKHLKNRGLRALKRHLATGHPQLHRVPEEGAGSKIMLRTRGSQSVQLAMERGTSLIGMCPIIMGAFYRQAIASLAQRFHRDLRPMVVIDLCHLIDRDKVLRGLQVLAAFDAPSISQSGHAPSRVSVVPVFLDDAGAEVFPHCQHIAG